MSRIFVCGAIASLVVASSVRAQSVENLASSGAPRSGFLMALLPDGTVLVEGGTTSGGAMSGTGQRYDPAHDAWVAASSSGFHTDAALTALHDATIVLEDDGETGQILESGAWQYFPMGSIIGCSFAGLVTMPDGRAVLVGGYDGVASSAETDLYDPGTGHWSGTPSLIEPRMHHSLTVLPSGKLLAVGGIGAEATAELFDPSVPGWASAQPSQQGVSSQCATLLTDGTVMVSGGLVNFAPGALAQRYQPAVDNWLPSGPLTEPRFLHTQSLLPDGTVVALGGFNDAGLASGSMDVYHPGSDVWTGASSTQNRGDHRAIVLPSGRLYVFGGNDGTDAIDQALEIDFSNPVASSTLGLSVARGPTHALALASGAVLLVGGASGAEIIDTAGNRRATGASLPADGLAVTRLRDGRALVLHDDGTSWLYDPQADQWRSTVSLARARSGATLTLLNDGRVLAAGGLEGDGGVSFWTDTFDPGAESWQAAADLPEGRVGHTATLLLSGEVLLVGGSDDTDLLLTGAVGSAAGDTWTRTQPLFVPRDGHTATLLESGEVLLTGGRAHLITNGMGATSAVELYNPQSSTFSELAGLVIARKGHAAVLLRNGYVLIAGGYADAAETMPQASIEWWSRWAASEAGRATVVTGGLSNARGHIGIARLSDGRVFLAGGVDTMGPSNRVDVFEEGRGEQPAWTPTLAATQTRPGGPASMGGTLFLGVSSATCDGWRASPTNVPVIRLEGPEGDVRNLPASAWNSVTANATVPASLAPGIYAATVTVNGVPSARAPFIVDNETCQAAADCLTRVCTAGHCVTSMTTDAGTGGGSAAGGGSATGGGSGTGGASASGGGSAGGGSGTTGGGSGIGGGGTTHSSVGCGCAATAPDATALVTLFVLVRRRARRSKR